jgi:diguanylate cyclase (GGDEF)-like protein
MNWLQSLQQQYRNGGLVKRIVALSVGLLLVIQISVQVILRNSIQDSVRQNLQTALASDAKVWARLVDQNAQRLQLGASLLAADFGFRAAVSSADEETIQSALDNHGARIGATVAALLNTDFVLTATASNNEGQLPASLLTDLSKSMVSTGQQGRLALVQGRLHQFVLVPVRAPVVVGWVVMGFAVDQSLANDMRALSAAHVLILDASTSPARVIYTSLGSLNDADLNQLGDMKGLFAVGQDEFAALRVSIDGKAQGVSAVLLRSSAEASKVFERMKSVLLLIDGLGLLLFAVGSSVMASRVSKPLGMLVEDTERIGRGDYSHAVADFGRRDEVGNLARSFDRMRINIQAGQVEIRQLAYWDRLTELPNRAQFREALQEAMSPEQSSAYSCVVMLDLDRFKHINDVLGYAYGDQVLKAVGRRLSRLAEGWGCLVARMGGGAFAVLLTGRDASAALLCAQQIAQSLEDPVSLDGQTVDISAGMGIACWPQHARQVDELLGHAEVAMYAAKRKHLGIVVYDATLDSTSAQNLTLLSELRQAIDGNELRLFLQPKIFLGTNAVSAAEALVRWEHPERGMVQPMQFIPFAEQTGFIRHLTLWMFEAAASQWHSLQPAQGQLRIAINLSTRDLMDSDFPAKIDALLAKYGVPRSGFCLEITESAIMDDPQRAEATLDQLAASGFKLSIDDFGTGYSSLAYLKSLPVNELKIDKSFVMGMEKDESDAKIVRSTIDLAHNLGLTVVAEGVENAHIYQLLADLQCDEAQGYYMSKPMLSTDFTAWRERWHAQHS